MPSSNNLAELAGLQGAALQQRSSIVGVAILLMFTVLIVFLFIQIRKQQRRIDELTRAAQQQLHEGDVREIVHQIVFRRQNPGATSPALHPAQFHPPPLVGVKAGLPPQTVQHGPTPPAAGNSSSQGGAAKHVEASMTNPQPGAAPHPAGAHITFAGQSSGPMQSGMPFDPLSMFGPNFMRMINIVSQDGQIAGTEQCQFITEEPQEELSQDDEGSSSSDNDEDDKKTESPEEKKSVPQSESKSEAKSEAKSDVKEDNDASKKKDVSEKKRVTRGSSAAAKKGN